MSNEEGIESGDLVKIESLRRTEPRLSINGQMQKMVGNEYSVLKAISDRARITYPETSESWVFAYEDLRLVKKARDVESEAMPTEKILFDPNELT